MPITIQVDEQDLEALKEFYVKKRMDLYNQANNINVILGQLERPDSLPHSDTIVQIAKSNSNSISPIYSKDWTWIDKIKYLINSKGGKATTAEIIEQFLTFEPISDKDTKKKRIASLSSVLSQNSKDDGIFTRKTRGDGVSIYSIKQ